MTWIIEFMENMYEYISIISHLLLPDLLALSAPVDGV